MSRTPEPKIGRKCVQEQSVRREERDFQNKWSETVRRIEKDNSQYKLPKSKSLIDPWDLTF